jgi:hypothetical protein
VKRRRLFLDCIKKISRKYRELGCKLGWSFLYTPKRTLNPQTKILFIALNPGVRNFEKPKPSNEHGNAYRVGKEVYLRIYSLLLDKNLGIVRQEGKFKTGWGEIECDLAQIVIGRKRMIVIGLPHLSRFGIFGREKISPDLHRLAKAVADHLCF